MSDRVWRGDYAYAIEDADDVWVTNAVVLEHILRRHAHTSRLGAFLGLRDIPWDRPDLRELFLLQKEKYNG